MLLSLLGTGCGRQQITVYTVPKEKPAPAAASTPPAGHNHPRPQLRWALPAGWKEGGSGQMSLASFSITGASGAQAQVTITPLARLAGRDVEIVNMWREQLGLDPLGREEVERQFEAVTVGGEPGRLFEIEGTPKGGTDRARIITAVVHREDASWFYKLAGDAALVEAQKPIFVEFLKSIQVQEAAGGEASPVADVALAGSKPAWQVPGHWREIPAGQMQFAKFSLPSKGAAKAEVSVSRFPNDTGGTLLNVNRWRRQLGLAELQEADLGPVVSAFLPSVPEARLVDLTNNNRRLVGAIVPRGGEFWFYKLLGDLEVVAAEKESFIHFVQSTP